MRYLFLYLLLSGFAASAQTTDYASAIKGYWQHVQTVTNDSYRGLLSQKSELAIVNYYTGTDELVFSKIPTGATEPLDTLNASSYHFKGDTLCTKGYNLMRKPGRIYINEWISVRYKIEKLDADTMILYQYPHQYNGATRDGDPNWYRYTYTRIRAKN